MLVCQPACKVWVSLERFKVIWRTEERGFETNGTLGEIMKQIEGAAVV